MGVSCNLPLWASPQAATLSLCPLLSSPLHWHCLVSMMITIAEKAACLSRCKQPLSIEKRGSQDMPAQLESTLPRLPCPLCAKLTQWDVKTPSLLFNRNFLARHSPSSPFLLAWHMITSLILGAVGGGRTLCHMTVSPGIVMWQRSQRLCSWTTGFWSRLTTNVYFFLLQYHHY